MSFNHAKVQNASPGHAPAHRGGETASPVIVGVGAGEHRSSDGGPATPKPADLDDVVRSLAQLSPLEYDRVRIAEAERLRVRVSALDAEVAGRRPAARSAEDGAVLLDEVEPWPYEVDGSDLLDHIRQAVCRFIVCDEPVATAVALWCAFTWFIDHVQVAPILLITAPDKQCGKTSLLDLVGRLARRPLMASNISPAAVFRVIEARRPALLIDEADTFLRDNDQLRGIINSGHTRQSAYVVRVEGEKFAPRQFSTWGAKAIAGIGRQAPTLMDRSIVLRLRRKRPHDEVDKLRHVEGDMFPRLARQLARFAQDHGETVRRARPTVPQAMNDRAQDNWEPLLAIADIAGGQWPSIARTAALSLTAANESSTEGLSTLLLSDIRTVLEVKGTDKIATADLIEGLCADLEKPWSGLQNGAPISDRRLASLLGDFGISPKNIKVGPSDVKRGYTREMFDDAFRRYLPASSTESPVTCYPASGGAASEVADEVAVAQEQPLPSLSELSGGSLRDDDPAASIMIPDAEQGTEDRDS